MNSLEEFCFSATESHFEIWTNLLLSEAKVISSQSHLLEAADDIKAKQHPYYHDD